MFNFKSITLKRFICVSFLLMFISAGLWIFQANGLSTSSDKVVEAQEKLARLKETKLAQFTNNVDYSIEQLAENLAFEKIESVLYIKVDGSTALAK